MSDSKDLKIGITLEQAERLREILTEREAITRTFNIAINILSAGKIPEGYSVSEITDHSLVFKKKKEIE